MSDGNCLTGYTSTGHRLSNSAFIDAHYAVCKKSYEAMLRSVGIQSGWHILDAGCGSGSFLPLMAELVGPNGKIAAFDLAPENIARSDTIAQELDTSITTQVGNLTDLPYGNNTFDAIWNANVTQYLTDDELKQMLKEFLRVLKPGGLVAIKEFDATMLQYYPLDRFVFWRRSEKLGHDTRDVYAVLDLPRWVRDAGFVDVSQKTFLEEIRAPLPGNVHAFLAGALQFFAEEAETLNLSELDMQHWRRCRDPKAPDNPVNHRDFYYREGWTLVTGTSP
jgi:ubiquinone/menaquinone biosynthesis C-methylase UbiE